jgi:hypothetical protein
MGHALKVVGVKFSIYTPNFFKMWTNLRGHTYGVAPRNWTPPTNPITAEDSGHHRPMDPCFYFFFKERLPKEREIPRLGVIQELLKLQVADGTALIMGQVNEALSDTISSTGRHITSVKRNPSSTNIGAGL